MRLVLGALAMAGMIDASVAQGAPPLRAPAPPAQQQRAAPGDLGMAIMSARVDVDGNLISGAGAESSTRSSNGIYVVNFGRNIDGCAPVATSTEYIELTYTIILSGSTAFVYSYLGRLGSYSSGAFSIVIYCHK